MKEGWKRVKLKDIASFNCSNLKKIENLEYINYLDTGNITEGKIDEIKKLYVGKDKIPSRAQRIVVPNDILLSSVRPNLRHYGLIKKPFKNMVASTGFINISVNEKIANSEYVYNYLRLNRIVNYISGIAESSTTTYPSITSKVVEELEIDLPPLEEQKEIASILSSLDDKIELNNEMNKTLEEMAQTLFKQWFIDFEFPNENGEPYKASGGKMVESELGDIPEGWEVNSLEKVCNQIVRGITPKYEEISEIKVLNQKVNKGTHLEKQHFKYLKKNMNIPKEKFAKKWDILLNSLGQGTLGRVHIYKENSNDVVVDQHISIIRTSNELLSIYIYNLLITNKYQCILENLVSGSTGMQMLNITKIRELRLLIPQKLELIKYLKELYEKIQENSSQIVNCRCLINTILPNLMSGNIDINE